MFVELCAGLASVTLHLFGTKPPVARVGSKAGYAADVARLLELERPEKALLVEADPHLANLLEYLVQDARALAHVIAGREWDVGSPTAVWRACRRERFDAEGPMTRAAAHLVWICGARGGIGGFKGEHKLRPSVDGFIPSRASLLRRLERLADVLPAGKISVRCEDARRVRPRKNAVVYIDPPYQDRQGFGYELPRADMLAVARRWAAVGCRVGISEAEPLPLLGWRSRALIRHGQNRRSLTQATSEWLTYNGGAR